VTRNSKQERLHAAETGSSNRDPLHSVDVGKSSRFTAAVSSVDRHSWNGDIAVHRFVNNNLERDAPWVVCVASCIETNVT